MEQKIEIKWTVLEADGTPNELQTETSSVETAIQWLGDIEREIEKRKVAQEIAEEN